MSYTPELVAELEILALFNLDSSQEGLKVHQTAAPTAIAAAQRGEVTAEVTSAHPLSDDQIAQLASKLKAREGKEVKVKASVDPEILGGLVVKIGSRQIDSSIRTRLNTLATAMKG